jgi:hypothetical protein
MHCDRSLKAAGRVTRQCRESFAAGLGLKRSTTPTLKRDASRLHSTSKREQGEGQITPNRSIPSY